VHEGLVTVESAFSVGGTVDRLSQAATGAGMVIFARIDHAQGARDVAMDLRPTELLIFGHPRGGTPLMQDKQTSGLDLPLKALAWEDEDGRVWLTYNDADWLAARHGLGAASAEAVAAVRQGLAKLAAALSAPA
jgi:uncharacterized protein (DUF302 family)